MKTRTFGWILPVSKLIPSQALCKTILTQSYNFCFSHHFQECELQSNIENKKSVQNLHGHSVKIEVSVVCMDNFFSRDFMNKEVHKVLQAYNNKILNNYLDKISCESLAQFLWEQLYLGNLEEYLFSLAIQETQKNRILLQKTSTNC